MQGWKYSNSLTRADSCSFLVSIFQPYTYGIQHTIPYAEYGMQDALYHINMIFGISIIYQISLLHLQRTMTFLKISSTTNLKLDQLFPMDQCILKAMKIVKTGFYITVGHFFCNIRVQNTLKITHTSTTISHK